MKNRVAQRPLENSSQPPPPSRLRPPVIMPSAGPSSAGLSQSSVQNSQPNLRPPSPDWPEWDIELDLNPWTDDEIAATEDIDLGPPRKRQKTDNTPTMS
jgi:hypothetical protein